MKIILVVSSISYNVSSSSSSSIRIRVHGGGRRHNIATIQLLNDCTQLLQTVLEIGSGLIRVHHLLHSAGHIISSIISIDATIAADNIVVVVAVVGPHDGSRSRSRSR